MGTLCQITVYAPTEAAAASAAKAAFARIKDLDTALSDYRPSSELMQLCRRAGGPPIKVSAELFYVLEHAQQVSELSNGAFDVSIGPLSHLWRRVRKSRQLPSPAEIAQAKERIGYRMIKLDNKAHTVQLLKPGMQLDLGGIAKGYAADQALAVLAGAGLKRALIAMGGDITVNDPPPGAPGWQVGIASLEGAARKPDRVLMLKHAAVSTSGDAEQHVEIGGVRYSHIVDPRTGLGLTGRQSVTVIAPAGIMADSLTKAVMILGGQGGLDIIEARKGTAAYIVRRVGEKSETFQSRNFASYLSPAGSDRPIQADQNKR